jgi:uncharacterized protein (DUF305 family)
MKKRTVLMGLVAFGVSFAAIGVTFASGPIEGRAGRAEVRFLEGMIDHHQMALDMANDCLGKATTETVQTLCQDIITAQTAEISTMQTWLLDWYNVQYTPMPMAEQPMEGMDHSTMQMDENTPVTDPPMMMGMMAGLARLEGQEYEVAFLESMIDHHDDAIHMSERILEKAPEGVGHVELREMAQTIITDQSAEIEAMEALITELSPQ